MFLEFTNIPWKRTIGSCRLCRPTGDWIIQAGSWDSVDIASCPDASAYELVPHVAGSLVKASKA